jgi:hypothetical protein
MTAIKWTKGGEGKLEALAGEAATIRSTIPSPPGSRLEGTLDDGTTVRVKIHACKKQEDGAFRLEGRMIDLTKVLRERLSGTTS